ncbi:AraC family transcriptional regulator [Ekhidna sp.]
MIHTHIDEKTNGSIQFVYEEPDYTSALKEHNQSTLTIVWNRGRDQKLIVDGEALVLSQKQIIVFTANQKVEFEHPKAIVAWHFNRDFYCIIDHDHEVSCAGLLFYGKKGLPIIDLSDDGQAKLELLFQVFLDEFDEEDDNLKTEMLRIILKRLIVKLTRWYKLQHALVDVSDKDIDVVREFNLLVEQHFRKYHQVQDYADLIHKSSKTISNLFSKYSDKSPLQTIHERILLEAKRLLIYTDKTTKEIAYEIGFQDIPGFSRFFKKHTQFAPSKYRQEQLNPLVGKN